MPEGDAAPALTPMMEAALNLREMYQAFVAAGFSDAQACMILGAYMAGLGNTGSERNE